MEKGASAYLLLGGNQGDRESNLAEAASEIDRRCGEIVRASSLYETAAWGPVSQPDYLNQVLLIRTNLPPHDLLHRLLDIERQMGRRRDERYGPRTIDLDILFYDNLTMDDEELIIPHPRLYTRRFVLVPLAEIAPKLRHPILGLTMRELLKQCADPLHVKKYIPANKGE